MLTHTHTHSHTTAQDKRSLATSALENRVVLDYFLNNKGSLDLFLRFLNDPGMIFTNGQELRKILALTEEESVDDETSGEVNLSIENLTDLD